MTRCPACAYPLRELEGTPRESTAAFERDVACPECGFVVPAGSRVVVGGNSASAMGGKGAWSGLWGAGMLGGIAVFVWIPDVIRMALSLLGGSSIPLGDFLFPLGGVAVTVLVAMQVITSLRARRDTGSPDEVTASNELAIAARGIVCAPGWVAVFDRAASRPTVDLIDGRLVRNVGAVLHEGKAGATRTAILEISARILPPAAPATPPVFVRDASDPLVLAWALYLSVRATPTVDLPALIERWAASPGGTSVKISVLRAEGDAARTPHAPQAQGFEIDPATNACVVRGVPRAPAPVDPAAAVSLTTLAYLVPAALGVAIAALVLTLQGTVGSWITALPLIAGALFIAGYMLFRRRIIWRVYSQTALWRISSEGVVISRGRRDRRVPASAIRSIDLEIALGVPYLVLRPPRRAKPLAVLVPDDWGGRAPETALAELRSALAQN